MKVYCSHWKYWFDQEILTQRPLPMAFSRTASHDFHLIAQQLNKLHTLMKTMRCSRKLFHSPQRMAPSGWIITTWSLIERHHLVKILVCPILWCVLNVCAKCQLIVSLFLTCILYRYILSHHLRKIKKRCGRLNIEKLKTACIGFFNI